MKETFLQWFHDAFICWKAQEQKVLLSYVSSCFTIVIIFKKKMRTVSTKVRYHPTFVQTTRAQLITLVNHL